MNGANSTGDGWDPSVSEEPFYVSGQNSQFTVINGVYQPIISMTVSRFCYSQAPSSIPFILLGGWVTRRLSRLWFSELLCRLLDPDTC